MSSATSRCPRVTRSSASSLLPMPLLPRMSTPTPMTSMSTPWTDVLAVSASWRKASMWSMKVEERWLVRRSGTRASVASRFIQSSTGRFLVTIRQASGSWKRLRMRRSASSCLRVARKLISVLPKTWRRSLWMCSVKPLSARPGFWMRELTTRRSRPLSPPSSSRRRSKSLSLSSCSIVIASIEPGRVTPLMPSALPEPGRMPAEEQPGPASPARDIASRVPPDKSSLRAVFAQPPFRTLWLAQFVSVFGDFMALFGVISLIAFRLHGSAVDVAMATVAYLAPFSLIAPAAGVLVDRWPVKRVMIASDLVRAVIAGSLVLVTDTHQIFAVMALLGLVSSFFGPAQSVAIRVLVKREDLLSANALLSQAFYAVRILSPALAGALVAWLSEKACFWIDAGTFLFSAAMIGRLAIVRAAAPQQGSLRAFGRDFVEGNRFIFTHRGLSFAFLASAAAMFMLSSFSPLISVYVRDTLHAGSLFYGAVSLMVGVGLVVGAQLIQRAARTRPMVQLVLGGLFGIGAGAAL